MKSKKAYIKLNGEVGEKELPCVEYVDNTYLNRIEKQKQEIKKLLNHKKTDQPNQNN